MKASGVAAPGHIATFFGAHEKKRHAKCAFALQSGGAVAGLLRSDAKAGGDRVYVVFRSPHLGQTSVMRHQHGGGETVRQRHCQTGHAARIGDAAGRNQYVAHGAALQQAGHMNQVKDAVGMVKRLGQEDFAPTLVLLAQCSGQVFGVGQAHGHTQPVTKAALEGGGPETATQVKDIMKSGNGPEGVRGAMIVPIQDHRAPDFGKPTLELFSDLKKGLRTSTARCRCFRGQARPLGKQRSLTPRGRVTLF